MAEESAEALVRDHVARADRRLASDRPIAEALVRPLSVVVPDVFVDGAAEVAGPEQHESIEALALDRTHEALRDRVHIWGLERGRDGVLSENSTDAEAAGCGAPLAHAALAQRTRQPSESR